MIRLEKIYKDKDWHKFKNKPVFPLGMNTPTNSLIFDLENSIFNFLVGGKESSAKINFFHCAIATLLKTSQKGSLKFILIGKKKSELALYENMPHLLFPFISKFNYAKEAIQWCLSEVHRRFQLSDNHTGSFTEYNNELKEKLPRIVVIIEDLDSLMKSNPKFFRDAFKEINFFSSLVNFHFIVGISKPSNSRVIPKKIIKGFFYRITFTTATSNDSKIMAGERGAEKLKNNEMLYSLASAKEKAIRLESFFISKKEIKELLKK